MSRKFNPAGAFLLLFLSAVTTFAQALCPFGSADTNALARCLLRPVRRGGNLGPTPATLPAPLDALIGKPMDIDFSKLRALMRARAIDEADLGGAFVVRDGRLINDLTRARYFVIHDTSWPEIDAREFPANINDATWPSNRLAPWLRSRTPAHVFVNRTGESATKFDFKQNVNGTKYDSGRDAPAGAERRRRAAERANQFLHIELIQPRRKSNPRTFFDLAPTPGMTPKQLDRLALLYAAASLRAGRWLLPAFHCAVDTPLPDAHDDPQNFDLNMWLGNLSSLLAELRGATDTADSSFASFDATDAFNLSEPTAATRGRELTLWSTFYHVFSAQQLDGGQPLLGTNGRSLGVALSERDWCNAVLEGTVAVSDGSDSTSTFNFSDRGAPPQLNCSRFFPSVPRAKINEMSRTRFEVAKGPYGTGVRGMILVPYRTIAVDSRQRPIPYGTVIYIPEARGKEIKLPSDATARHDGYFFAADTGTLIKNNHIDVFSGTNERNPFPQFIKSVATGTFKAFVINDTAITNKMREAHRPGR